MANFDPRIINSNPRPVSGTPILIGIGLVLLLILMWASLAYVPPGNVGVLVYFGYPVAHEDDARRAVLPVRRDHPRPARRQPVRELAGAVGMRIQRDNDSAEIGYWIGMRFWGVSANLMSLGAIDFLKK
jgi:hypothetical protein